MKKYFVDFEKKWIRYENYDSGYPEFHEASFDEYGINHNCDIDEIETHFIDKHECEVEVYEQKL